MNYRLFFFLLLFCCASLNAQDISHGKNIFDFQEEHTHGATIVELPNGDLLSAWFQGHGERWADDVQIMGARYSKKNAKWSAPFLMADVPDFPDVNPVLFLDPKQQLWLVWYTVLANQWESSLPKYRISTNYMQESGPPEWTWQDVIHVRPGDSTERGIQPNDKFIQSIEKQYEHIYNQLIAQGTGLKEIEQYIAFKNHILAKAKGENHIASGRIFKEDGSYTNAKLGYPISRRIGWQTKNKAVFVGDRLILPLYSDGLEMSIFAITDDFGKHWQFSDPIVGIANIQATVAKKKDGTLVAYMRDNGPPPMRHPMTISKDKGMTWSMVEDSHLPNPGSGSDLVTLANGHWVMAYNDTERGRHSLAISLSENEGQTWDYIRHVELDNSEKPHTAAYPSIIQGKDGTIHIIYSYTQPSSDGKTETTRYFAFDESWIKKGDDGIEDVFKVGAAVRVITPDPLLPVSGGIGTPKPATQKKGKLYARAMVFEKGDERVAVVNIDNLGWPKALGDKSRALIKGIKPEHVLIGATHTHSGPDAYAFPDENGQSGADLKYLDWCVQQIADAVNEAVQKLEPAHLKIAEGEAKGKIAFNYYAERLYDPRCNIIQAVRPSDNKVIATLVNYAIHPEVIGNDEGILSPDLCGPLYKRIEDKTGGIAVFMNGALGGMVTADNRVGQNDDDRTWEESKRIGELLADEALRIVDDASIQQNPSLHCTANEITFPIDSEMLKFILNNSPLNYGQKDASQISTQMNLVNIGSAQILTIPGEALPNIGYYLKRNMKGEQNMLFGLTNDAFGYILTPEDFDSFKVYDYITRTSLGERTGEILVNHALRMIEGSPVPYRSKK